MHSNTSLQQIPSGYSRGPGPVSTSNLADSGEFRLGLEGPLYELLLNQWGADASPSWPCGAGPGSVRDFPQFEHGAGI
jgi:hypothetical protein